MKPITFKGLNCFQECVISVVNHMGLNYSDAFYDLWSERDFRYDHYRKVYLTKRMIINLEKMGAKVECFDCFSKEEVIKRLSLFNENDFMIIGIDAFHIPWSQLYKILNGSHYIVVQKVKEDMLPSIDPTYNKVGQFISYEAIINNTFDICHINKALKMPFEIKLENEPKRILHTHDNTLRELISLVKGCEDKNKEEIALVAKYIDTMINNRQLYSYFLKEQGICWEREGFFLQWLAVKNGLYKIALSRSKGGIIHDVCRLIEEIIAEEIFMAREVLKGYTDK